MFSSSKPESRPRGHIPSLDGIRAVAVMLVVVAHAGYSHLVPGGLGVTIFFFLSGYLITTLFYRERHRTQAIDLRAFYLRRLLRLSPPLLVSLAVGYGLLGLGLARGGFEFGNFLSQLFYFANYYQLYGASGETIDGQFVLWSLAVEEHFYLLYPVVFIMLARGKTTRDRVLPMLTLLAMGFVWRCLLIFGFGVDDDHLLYSTDSRLDSILYGCLLAVLREEGQLERFFPRTRKAALAFELAAVGVLLVTLVYRDPAFRQTLRYSLQGIAMFPLFYYSVLYPDAPLHRPLNWRPIRAIGIYSYSIYLLHHVIFYSLEYAGGLHESWLRLFVGTVLSIAYGALIYQWVDRPIMKFRRRLQQHEAR